MLQRVTFKDKNKLSANPAERTLTDVDINQIKGKLNKTIDAFNSTVTDQNGNFLNYYTKQETEQLIDKETDQIADVVAVKAADSAVKQIISHEYINQLNFDLNSLLNKIEEFD